MPQNGHWVGDPYDGTTRDCREVTGNGWTWHLEILRLWQEVNEQGVPVGDPYPKHYDWRDQADLISGTHNKDEMAWTYAQGLVTDVGMGRNYFDADIVKHTTQALWPTK